MMLMKCQFHWWRKPEHQEESTDLQQVTDNIHTDGLCPDPVPNSGRSGVKAGDHESNALAHWATEAPFGPKGREGIFCKVFGVVCHPYQFEAYIMYE